MMDLYDGLLEELECKICMTYMAPPIRQCVTGHSICQPCMKKLNCCPLCQGKFTDARNISLETLARKVHYPCPNAKLGCDVRSTLDNRDKHEKICSYKGYKCAFPRCAWNGPYEDILSHWATKKQTGRPYRDVSVCHTKVNKPENFYVNLVEAHNQLFWFRFKNNCGKLYWSVQYIGNEEISKNYYFEVEILKPGEAVRKYIMTDYCSSENEPETNTCVMTTIESISSYLGEDQVLIYYLRIKKVGDIDSNSVVKKSENTDKRPHFKQFHQRRSNSQSRFKNKN